MHDPITIERRDVAILLLVLQIWPIHAVWKAWQQAPLFIKIFDDFDVELPLITLFFFATYRFWFVVPALTILLALACFHPRVKRAALPVACLAFTLLGSYAMTQVVTQSTFAPLVMLINALT